MRQVWLTRNFSGWHAIPLNSCAPSTGPFHTRAEAEKEARKLGFGFLLRYEHVIGDNDDIQEVRCIFIELPAAPIPVQMVRKLHTRCATCGESGHPR